MEIVYGVQKAVVATNDPAERDALVGQVEHGSNRFKKEYYQETILMPFENIEIPVPAMYDAVLKAKYGDYSRLVHNWDTHDYPFYKGQLEIWEKKTGVQFPKYVFSESDLESNCRKSEIPVHGEKRREVVFLPYKASMWESMAGCWKEAAEDPDCDVFVIPIPYCDRNIDRSFHEIHYEGDLYPRDVQVMWYEDYDFEKRRPDVIYIQNPYDEYNQATSVLPFFYAKNLKQFTDCLVYVSSFRLTEILPEDKRAVESLEYFVKVPGVVCANQVIVSSEGMKKTYVDALTVFAGEQTRSVWEGKGCSAGCFEAGGIFLHHKGESGYSTGMVARHPEGRRKLQKGDSVQYRRQHVIAVWG